MNCLDRVLRPRALRLAVVAFVIAPSAPAMTAECAQWNVAGQHTLFQSNLGSSVGATPIQMTLQQDGTLFKGSIRFTYRNGEVDAYLDRTGDIVGTVVGNRFEATVYWSDNKVGAYSGQIGPQGLVAGRTFNKNNPSESADFHGSPPFDCLTASAPSAPASSGKPAIALGRTNAPAAPAPKVSQLPGSAGQLQPARNQQLLAPKASAGAAAVVPTPTIAEPREGVTYPPQTPLIVRVTPAKDAKDAAYRIEIEVEQNVLVWRNVATLEVPAAVAQSPQGYRGWGAKQDPSKPWTEATPGTWRVRVSPSTQQLGKRSDWVVFRIAGQPGNAGGDGNAAQSAPQPLPIPPKAPAAALAAKPLPGARNDVPAALLTPQALPRRTLSAAPAATSLDAARNKTAPVLLNPQPLPPGGLQQAPSSLR
jgi:hypothetical protein